MINLRGLDGQPEERRAVLAGMGRQLARRGPDDEQFFDDGHLAFVFRRLAVVDLEGGRQPFWNEDGTVLAAVNGEIYNHRELRRELADRHTFRTDSDCEVVVHLYEEYGDAFPERLNGMFAILLWDTRQRRLLLVRDRLGIKRPRARHRARPDRADLRARRPLPARRASPAGRTGRCAAGGSLLVPG